MTACVRVPGADGKRVQHVEQFKTTVGGLLVLADWLKAHQVTHVVMEATGDYWKPVWHLLEGDFELMLVNARDVKHIKLDCVATDILGKSGRDMLDALIAGTTDPAVLADLARGKMRKKIPALREALEGRFEPLHALLIGAILAHLDFLDEQIERLSEAIGEQIAPFERAVELLCTIPGVGRRTAELIIGEIGVDMSVFPTAAHLASSAGQCPGNDQSAGKRRSGRTRKGSKHLNAALKDAAIGALRTNDSYLQALYRRKKSQHGHGRALGAVKHSMICACWHMLSTGELYKDLGDDYYRVSERSPCLGRSVVMAH